MVREGFTDDHNYLRVLKDRAEKSNDPTLIRQAEIYQELYPYLNTSMVPEFTYEGELYYHCHHRGLKWRFTKVPDSHPNRSTLLNKVI